MIPFHPRLLFFFFNDTATTEIYTLSLHDALPISAPAQDRTVDTLQKLSDAAGPPGFEEPVRSEEHTSELQSRLHLVCRLLLEKKKTRGACPDDNAADGVAR